MVFVLVGNLSLNVQAQSTGSSMKMIVNQDNKRKAGRQNSGNKVLENKKWQTGNWVVTDALGRTIPAYEEAGPVRENRKVGVFYYLWSGFHGTKVYDITKIIEKYPGCRFTSFRSWCVWKCGTWSQNERELIY